MKEFKTLNTSNILQVKKNCQPHEINEKEMETTSPPRSTRSLSPSLPFYVCHTNYAHATLFTSLVRH